MASTYPHVRVAGSPEERGRTYGEQARDRVRQSIDAYRDVFGYLTGWDWPRVLAETRRFEAPIAEYDERFLREIHGIAEGAGVDPADVLALNVRTEIVYAAKARQAARLAGGCTAIAVLPEASASGETLLAQNWDWYPHSRETVVVLESAPDDGPAFVTVVEAGLLAKAGLNAAGLGLVTNALGTDADAGKAGVPYHVVLRAILDCETISAALHAIQRGFRASSASYVLAHADGLAACVEALPGDFSALHLLFPEDGLVVHSNHFLAPAFSRKDVSLWASPDSPFRLDRARRLLEPPVLVEDLERLLTDHANEPNAICCHPDPQQPEYEQGITAASLIMELDSRTMLLADGPPCSTAYRRLDLSALFA